MAIAASIALTLLGGYLYWDADRGSAPQANVVGHMRKVVIGESKSQATSVAELIEGKLVDFPNGNYSIVLKNGVTLTFAVESSFLMESPMLCKLLKGRVTADVPKQAHGFTIATKHFEAIDRGTQFGVAVGGDGSAAMAVFDGEVDVSSPHFNKKLYKGRGISMTAAGEAQRLSLVSNESFGIHDDQVTDKQATLLSVSDSFHVKDQQGYYRIIRSGFGEDMLAYVDRLHQWNGVDDAGLPVELVGGDYLMPFNADKSSSEFQITLEISRRANVYVLMDSRTEVPLWLERDFVKTDMKVGQDEGGRWKGKGRKSETAIGPGLSIDEIFTVWKRREAAVGKIVLGPLVESPLPSRSMYGVVAVPVTD